MANGKKPNKLDEYEYVECRLRRHQWDGPKMFALSEKRTSFVVMRFTCRTCKMERTDVYTRMGDLDHRYYRPPTGYHIQYEENEERLTTRDVARWMIRRQRQGELPMYEE